MKEVRLRMFRLKRALFAAVLAICCVESAFAQVAGNPFELSAGGGLFVFDTRAHIRDAAALRGSLGWRAFPWMTLEAAALAAFSESALPPNPDHDYTYLGGDLRWNLRPAESRAVPFALTGVGYVMSRTTARPPEDVTGLGASLGLGLNVSLWSQRTYARFEVRDVMVRDRGPAEINHHFALTGGLHWVFGGKARDGYGNRPVRGDASGLPC
jgi:hypothetical protein